MAAVFRSFARLLNESILAIETTVLGSLRGFQPHIALGDIPYFDLPNTKNEEINNGIFENGILWAVPKNRRTIEKRLKRKFGHPFYRLKILVPNQSLGICDTCGHHHEANVLCPNCYAKVKQETEAIQEAIQNDLGLSPVEKDIVLLYEGEKEQHPSDLWKGKRIVELKRSRPSWFSQNLLQKSVEKSPLPEVSAVKPTDLG